MMDKKYKTFFYTFLPVKQRYWNVCGGVCVARSRVDRRVVELLLLRLHQPTSIGSTRQNIFLLQVFIHNKQNAFKCKLFLEVQSGHYLH